MKEFELISSDTSQAFETTVEDNNGRDLDQSQRKSLFLALDQVASALDSSDDEELFVQVGILGQQIAILYHGASADHYNAIIEALKKHATQEETQVLARIEKCLENSVAQKRLACLQVAIGDVQADDAVFLTDPIKLKKLDPQKIGVIFFNAFGKGESVPSDVIESRVKELVESLAATQLQVKRILAKNNAIQLDPEELQEIEREARAHAAIEGEQEILRALPAYRENTELYRSLAARTDSNEDRFLRESDRARNELVLKANLKILENNIAKLENLMKSTSLEESENKNLIRIRNAAQKLLDSKANTSKEKINKAIVAQSKKLEFAIRRLKQKELEINQKQKKLEENKRVVYRNLGHELIEVGGEELEDKRKEEERAEERILSLDAAVIANGDLEQLKGSLQDAVRGENKQLVEFFINFVDKEGRTLLHRAARAGDMEFLELLKQNGVNGADVIAEDNDGKTPLDYAVANSNLEMVDCLLEIMHHDMGEDSDRCHYHEYVYNNTLQKVKSKFAENKDTPPLVEELAAIGSELSSQDPTPAVTATYMAAHSQLETVLHPDEPSAKISDELTSHVKEKYGILSGLLDRVSSAVGSLIEFMRGILANAPKPKEAPSQGLRKTLLNVAAANSIANSATGSTSVKRPRVSSPSFFPAVGSPPQQPSQQQPTTIINIPSPAVGQKVGGSC